jgi:hypothetical protein
VARLAALQGLGGAVEGAQHRVQVASQSRHGCHFGRLRACGPVRVVSCRPLRVPG